MYIFVILVASTVLSIMKLSGVCV